MKETEISWEEELLGLKEKQYENASEILYEQVEGRPIIDYMADEIQELDRVAIFKVRESLAEEIRQMGGHPEVLDHYAKKKVEERKQRVLEEATAHKSVAERIYSSDMSVNPEAPYQRADQIGHFIQTLTEYHAREDESKPYVYTSSEGEEVELHEDVEVHLILNVEKRYKEVANIGYQQYAEQVVQDAYGEITLGDLQERHAKGTHFPDIRVNNEDDGEMM